MARSRCPSQCRRRRRPSRTDRTGPSTPLLAGGHPGRPPAESIPAGRRAVRDAAVRRSRDGASPARYGHGREGLAACPWRMPATAATRPGRPHRGARSAAGTPGARTPSMGTGTRRLSPAAHRLPWPGPRPLTSPGKRLGASPRIPGAGRRRWNGIPKRVRATAYTGALRTHAAFGAPADHGRGRGRRAVRARHRGRKRGPPARPRVPTQPHPRRHAATTRRTTGTPALRPEDAHRTQDGGACWTNRRPGGRPGRARDRRRPAGGRARGRSPGGQPPACTGRDVPHGPLAPAGGKTA